MVILLEEEAKCSVTEFKKNFYSRFGSYPEVNYILTEPSKKKISREVANERLSQIEEVINNHLWSINPSAPIAGIKSKMRQKEVVEHRHYFFVVVRVVIGIGLSDIGNYLDGFDHATVLHGIKSINNLLKIKDRKIVNMVNSINDQLILAFPNDHQIKSFIIHLNEVSVLEPAVL